MADPNLDAGLQLQPPGRQVSRPGLARGRRRPRHLLALGVLATVLVAAGARAAPPGANLPSLGEPADATLSPAQERQLGQAVLQNIRARMPLVHDALLNAYIQDLGDRLLNEAPEPHIPFTFLIARTSSINAFAATGGVIVIYAGLIEATHSEAELAAVMAHEIAHVTQRHIARTLEENRRIGLATLLAVLTGIAVGAHAPEAGNALSSAAVAGNLQSQLNFSRAFEREADATGIDILARAGYSPEAMADFFARLARSESSSEAAIPELLRTHPVTSERIAAAEDRAAGLGHPQRSDTLAFELAKARLEALTRTPRDIIAAYSNADRVQRAQPAYRYRYAIALRRAGQARQSSDVLQALLTTHPNNVPMQLALAVSSAKAGQVQDALRQLRQLDDIYRAEEPIVVTLARLELAHGHPAEALHRLRELAEARPVQPDTLFLEARVAAAAGQHAFSHETLARYYFMLGRHDAAFEQIALALRTPSLGSVEEARLRSLRRRMQGHREP